MEQELKIFIGGIAARELPSEIEAYFSKFGPLLQCRIKSDRKTGLCLGFGYVTCAEVATYENILSSSNHCINGRVVECKKMLKKEQLDEQIEEERKKKLFIGNLSLGTSNESLYQYFIQFGPIINAYVICKPGTEESKGFGFVIYEDLDSVNDVMKIKKHYLDGKKIICSKFKNKQEQKEYKDKKEDKKKPIESFDNSYPDHYGDSYIKTPDYTQQYPLYPSKDNFQRMQYNQQRPSHQVYHDYYEERVHHPPYELFGQEIGYKQSFDRQYGGEYYEPPYQGYRVPPSQSGHYTQGYSESRYYPSAPTFQNYELRPGQQHGFAAHQQQSFAPQQYGSGEQNAFEYRRRNRPSRPARMNIPISAQPPHLFRSPPDVLCETEQPQSSEVDDDSVNFLLTKILDEKSPNREFEPHPQPHPHPQPQGNETDNLSQIGSPTSELNTAQRDDRLGKIRQLMQKSKANHVESHVGEYSLF